jgi:cytochrome c-type biogenesis protein CcmH
MNYLKIVIIITFFLISSATNAQDTNNELVKKISKNVRCLVCQGQSVYDSNSDFALSVKLVINRKIKEGYTESQIYEYLRNQYGEWIVYEPKFNKSTFFLWLLPILVFITGGWLIIKKINFFKL